METSPTTPSFFNAPATPRFMTAVAGIGAVAIAAWFSLIAAHQASYHDPLCGNVSAVAVERYAQCVTAKFAGHIGNAEGDLTAAVAHLKAEGFVAAPAGEQTYYHPGSLLMSQSHDDGALVLSLEDGQLKVEHEIRAR